jgi:hypothetical protein
MISLRLAIFFASNPDIELTPSELAKKFGIRKSTILETTAASVRLGIIEKVVVGRHDKSHKVYVFRAGQTLLDEL